MHNEQRFLSLHDTMVSNALIKESVWCNGKNGGLRWEPGMSKSSPQLLGTLTFQDQAGLFLTHKVFHTHKLNPIFSFSPTPHFVPISCSHSQSGTTTFIFSALFLTFLFFPPQPQLHRCFSLCQKNRLLLVLKRS